MTLDELEAEIAKLKAAGVPGGTGVCIAQLQANDRTVRLTGLKLLYCDHITGMLFATNMDFARAHKEFTK